ncbi:MAG TPA: hypothetical protein VGP31_10600 [Planosporangium sp.]|nr:hypothetical protein [Planosporangium sp.]
MNSGGARRAPEEHFILIGAGRGMPRATASRAGHAHAAALDWTPAGRQQARYLSGERGRS